MVAARINPETGERFYPGYEWAMGINDDWDVMEIKNRFKQCEYWERRNIALLNQNVTSVGLPDMFGLEKLFDAFAKLVVKSLFYRQVVGACVKQQQELNIHLMGTGGNGKRTATLRLAEIFNISHATITSKSYKPGSLQLIHNWSKWRFPFLLYIDGFDKLVKNPEFVSELLKVYSDGRNNLIDWNTGPIMYTVIATETQCEHLHRVCVPINMVDLRTNDTADMLRYLSSELAARRITTISELTPQNIAQMQRALSGATMADVARFVGTVACLITKSTDVNAMSRIVSGSVQANEQIPVVVRHPSDPSITATAMLCVNADFVPSYKIPWPLFECLFVPERPSQTNSGLQSACIPRYATN